MIEITTAEKELCDVRPNQVNHIAVAGLHFLGNYIRDLPISIDRMMENAYDWEHLPYIHASSFSAIEKISSGTWGWRAKIRETGANQACQVIELLVDRDKNYWASCVVSGPGQGIEIHTQATSKTEFETQVDIRFYSASEIPADQVGIYLDVLTQQYALLYDEDIALMSGRQSALDDRAKWNRGQQQGEQVLVGNLDALERQDQIVVDTDKGRYCVRKYNHKWVVHSAVCTHLLGPLDQTNVAVGGIVSCPWHGYRFNIETGENIDGKCRPLKRPPAIKIIEGSLFLIFPAQ